MFSDNLLRLSSAQAFTSGTTASTNTIDFGNPSVLRNVGDGVPMTLVLVVTTGAHTSSGDETYQFDLIQSANADLSSPTVLESRVIARGSLPAGTFVFIPIPPGAITAEYVGYRAILGGTGPTISLTAQLMPQNMIERFTAYAKGYTIS
jgi:hypothetical protein